MKILEINVKENSYNAVINDDFSILDYNIKEHLKEKTYNYDPLSKHNFITFNSGILTGQGIPGAHRLIVVGRSPLTQGFFLSTIGGVGEELYRTGFNIIKIKEKAINPSIVIVRRLNGKLSVNVEEINDLNEIYEKNGVFSLQEYLVNKYKSFFSGTRYRSIVAGPSGFNSVLGGLSSVRVINDSLDYGSEGFAGRGGYGSVLAQAHNIAGIMIGGDLIKEKNPFVKEVIDNKFKDEFLKFVVEKTIKYKGKGTFKSNYENLKTDALMFNWQSVEWQREKRLLFYNKLINNYIDDYSPSSKSCGEACPAVCKKIEKIHVMDYEPYNSCGPNLGIFSREAARNVVNFVDKTGFDAISIGNLLSTIFEAENKGKLKLDESPSFNPETYDIKDSFKNSKIAISILRKMALGKFPELSKGIRHFCETKGIEGVYFAFGSKGVISPNEYLRPGFIAPLPMLGKFTTYYKKGFLEPYKLGKLSADRLIKELYNEDTGFCRFHRGWAEQVIPSLINAATNKKINYYEYIKSIINKIIKYNKEADSLPKYWPNKKTEHLVYAHLIISSEDNETTETNKWKNKFKNDYNNTNKEYWNELIKGVCEILGGDYKDALC